MTDIEGLTLTWQKQQNWEKIRDYFVVNPMSDSKKIFTSAMYMDGADLSYLEYVERMGEISWEQFRRLVVDRLSNESGKNIVAQFNQLKLSADVASYTMKFEELKPLKAFMAGEDRSLKEEYFVQSYIRGLKDKIYSMVEMFNPQSLRIIGITESIFAYQSL